MLTSPREEVVAARFRPPEEAQRILFQRPKPIRRSAITESKHRTRDCNANHFSALGRRQSLNHIARVNLSRKGLTDMVSDLCHALGHNSRHAMLAQGRFGSVRW